MQKQRHINPTKVVSDEIIAFLQSLAGGKPHQKKSVQDLKTPQKAISSPEFLSFWIRLNSLKRETNVRIHPEVLL